MNRILSSLFRSCLAIVPASVLAAACNGNVIVEEPAGVEEPAACDEGLSLCQEDCVDLNTDPGHCGGCGAVCPGGVCSGGACQMAACQCATLCEIEDLGSSVPQFVWATTVGAPDSLFTQCGAGSGGDVTFRFTAPYDGLFSFDTFGTPDPTLNTTIQISSLSCEILGCNNDYAINHTSALALTLLAGQGVLVTVDTVLAPGDVQLRIHDVGQGCQGCAEAITEEVPSQPVCPGSEPLFLSLIDCVCAGACQAKCDPVCNFGEMTEDCQICVTEPAGCGDLFAECANDL